MDGAKLPIALLALGDKDSMQLRLEDGERLFWVVGKGSDDLLHGEHRDISAGGAVAEMTGRHHVGLMDACCEFGALLNRELGKPVVDRSLYLGGVSALPLANEMLDSQLAPKVEVNFWPSSAATQLADFAGSPVRRTAVAEQ